MWAGARNIVATMEGVLLGLEAIAMVARRHKHHVEPLQDAVRAVEALEGVNELVVTLVETMQGKLNGAQLCVAMRLLIERLDANEPIPVALEAMRSRL